MDVDGNDIKNRFVVDGESTSHQALHESSEVPLSGRPKPMPLPIVAASVRNMAYGSIAQHHLTLDLHHAGAGG
jgi:hypothetical protein